VEKLVGLRRISGGDGMPLKTHGGLGKKSDVHTADRLFSSIVVAAQTLVQRRTGLSVQTA
jgi:hypothetical protein